MLSGILLMVFLHSYGRKSRKCSRVQLRSPEFGHLGPRSATDPFFLAQDMKRPYTYTAAMSDLHFFLAMVSEDIAFGIHGLRVLGYNLSKQAVGEDLTVAHGLWTSKAHTRYERFGLLKVFGISSAMMGVPSPYASANPPERSLRERLAPAASQTEVEAGGGEEDAEEEEGESDASGEGWSQAQPPPGWTVTPDGRRFVPPASMAGASSASTPARAWRIHRAVQSLQSGVSYENDDEQA